jgi:hypothetical protein
MWHLFQLLIVFAVGGTNIVYHWTDNGYVVALFGGIAAYLATVIVAWIIALPCLFRLILRRCTASYPYSHGYPSSHISRIPRSTWHRPNTLEDLGRTRISDDSSEFR